MILRAAVVFLVAVAVYGVAVRNGFLFDDVAQVQTLKPAEGFVDWITSAGDSWWPEAKGKFVWRPLTRMFILAQKSWVLSSSNPESAIIYHAVSLALHALASVLAMLVAARLGAGARMSLFAGLALAVHPFRGEAVHQIVGQAELLAAILMMFGLILHANRRSGGAEVGKFYLFVQAAIFLAALGAKEHAILYPAYVWLVGMCFPSKENAGSVRLLLITLGAVAVVYLGARYAVLGGLSEPAASVPHYENPLAQMGIASRVPAALGLFGYFLTRAAVPWGLSPDYSWDSLPVEIGWAWPMAWVGVVVVAGLLVLMCLAFLRRSVIAPLVLIFLLGYGFISNALFTHGAIFAPRLLYWPMIAGIILGAVGVSQWRERRHLSPKVFQWGVIIASSVIVLWASVSWRESRAWRTPMDFALKTIEVFPRCWRAQHNLAREYYLIKDFENGYRHACISTTLRPDDPRSWDTRGVNAMFMPGKERDAETSILEAIRLKPELDLPYQHLANLMRMQGREAEAQSYAQKYLELSAEKQPTADAP